MNTVKVRSVVAEDLPELGRIDGEIFEGLAYPRFVLRQLFDVHQDEMLVADCAGEMIGYSIAVRSGATSERDLGHFLALGVAPEHRGRGVGRQLAQEALELLRCRGVRRVLLAVRPENHVAIGLWRSLGFDQAGNSSDYYGQGEPRLLFNLRLATQAAVISAYPDASGESGA